MKSCDRCKLNPRHDLKYYCKDCIPIVFAELTEHLADYECVKELSFEYRETNRRKTTNKVIEIGTLCKVHPRWTTDDAVFINDSSDRMWHEISKDEFNRHFTLREQMTLF